MTRTIVNKEIDLMRYAAAMLIPPEEVGFSVQPIAASNEYFVWWCFETERDGEVGFLGGVEFRLCRDYEACDADLADGSETIHTDRIREVKLGDLSAEKIAWFKKEPARNRLERYLASLDKEQSRRSRHRW